jgi:CubicO group peptidase (beta-lactamase class C family)
MQIAVLAEHGFLRNRLAELFARVRCKQVAVGLLYAGESSYALVGDRAEAESFATPTGCLTKLFTATLARNACSAGWFGLDDRIADLLGPAAASSRGVLDGVTVRQLLEHTHGLDDTMIACVPHQPDGFIDCNELRAELAAATPLAEPGRLYSYANAGAWLIGALLEKCLGRRYDALLRDQVVTVPAAGGEGAVMCPSIGGALTVTIVDMLEFLRRHALDGEQPWPSDDRLGDIAPLPGWNALERGVYLGWKYHGGGWFGHSSTWPRASALVRIHPQHRVAFAIASREHPAPVVAAKLFGRIFPELVDFRIPPTLDAERVRRLDLDRYVGVYRSAARSVQISRVGGGLHLSSQQLGRNSVRRHYAGAVLRAAANDVFFAQPADIDSFTCVQFISPRSGRFDHLWNGRFVLRRIS